MPELVVTAVLVEGRSNSEVARDYGVTLVQRYLAEGDAGLQPRSRRPRHNPARTDHRLEDAFVEVRKELDRAGHGMVRGHPRRPPHPPARHQPGGLHHLADPFRRRVRHPAAAQATQEPSR
jgi:hypothetical protein